MEIDPKVCPQCECRHNTSQYDDDDVNNNIGERFMICGGCGCSYSCEYIITFTAKHILDEGEPLDD